MHETFSSISFFFGAADASKNGLAEQLNENSIIAEFLAFPRGGTVSGAAVTSRKREQINKLVGVIQDRGNGLDEGDEDDAVVKQQVSKLSDILRGWVHHLPEAKDQGDLGQVCPTDG